MMRRGFLGALLGAPVAAQSAIASGASTVGVSYPENMVGGSDEGLDDEFLAHDRLADHLHDHLNIKNGSHVFLSEGIKSMKSWSPVFKQHVAKQDTLRRRSIHRAINDAMRDKNPITRGLALARIASDLRTKL